MLPRSICLVIRKKLPAAGAAMQVLGGYGYVGEYVVSRLWRDAKLIEIGGGTLEACDQLRVRARGALEGKAAGGAREHGRREGAPHDLTREVEERGGEAAELLRVRPCAEKELLQLLPGRLRGSGWHYYLPSYYYLPVLLPGSGWRARGFA